MTKFRLSMAGAILFAIAACPLLPSALSLVLPAYAQGASGTGVDLSPALTAGLSGVSLLIVVVALWFINGHVKDANARTALLGIVEKGVSLGYNVVNGALKDKVVSVNVGSSVAAQALKYVLQFGPDAAKHFGLDNASLAKMIWARLPHVDGTVTDETFNQIVASATGGPATISDVGKLVADAAPALVDAIVDLIAKRKAADPAKPVAPAA
jgi:hypothetical protein